MRMKKYIDCYIPTETCNFKCKYCYIARQNKFNNKILKLSHTIEEIKCALSKDRLGGECLINLCAGGETLLSDDVVSIAKALLENGHYVMIVTNCSITRNIEKICNTFDAELLKHLFFKCSFHYLELKRMGLLNEFAKNINTIKNSNASYTIEITPNDELEPYIEEIKLYSMSNFGALPHITIARDDTKPNIDVLSSHSFEEYYNIWRVFDSPLLDYKKVIYQVKRKEFCYAGDWSGYLNIETGNLKQCYGGNNVCNIYKDIDLPLPKNVVGCNCHLPYCYNGHSFIVLGDIPELDSPNYAMLRNRICSDGSEWLKPEMKAFMSRKLYDYNDEYGVVQKALVASKKKCKSIIKKLKNR